MHRQEAESAWAGAKYHVKREKGTAKVTSRISLTSICGEIGAGWKPFSKMCWQYYSPTIPINKSNSMNIPVTPSENYVRLFHSCQNEVYGLQQGKKK